MDWLLAIDVAVFRFINQRLGNPLFDAVLPFFSWNALFLPAVIFLAVWLLWKGGAKGRVFIVMLILATAIGDGVLCRSLKKAVGRERPFAVVPDAQLRVGKGGSGSMPSSHAANWAAGAVVTGVFFPAALRIVLPIALIVAFSRVYLGVHYPSDVAAGLALGAGSAGGIVFLANALWRQAGRRWFPLWWMRLPSLLPPKAEISTMSDLKERTETASPEAHWLRLGYVLIAALLLIRLAYLASGKIELSEDEAYQWQWSKHPALSYFSKPPLIAYAQYVGTHLWGDTAFGVRFLSPCIAAVLSFLLLRFLTREVNVRAGLALLLAVTATPLMAVGATLMTIDALSVLFWTAAVLAGWKALKEDSTRAWAWAGVWMGFGFLAKYTALFQWLCWAVLFVAWKPARAQLRRPGPYLALFINLLFTIPVLVWNAQNGWITVTHLENRAGLDQVWRPTLRFFQDFVLSEFGLLNPVFFVGIWMALWGLWRAKERAALPVYLFSMGLPLFAFYFFYTFRARVQPNWIAPALLPMLAAAIVYWEERSRRGAVGAKRWLFVGFFLGVIPVVLLHDTNLIGKIAGRPLPPKADPLVRVRGWEETARVVEREARELEKEGRPVFYIGGHYGITSLLSFYIPAAKAGVPDQPLCFYLSSDHPQNQYYFWPGYKGRKGQSAIYARRTKEVQPAPEQLLREFESVTDLGLKSIEYRGRVFHQVQLFACRNLQ